MPLSLVEMAKRISDPVASGVVENIVTVDELTAFLPWTSLGQRDSYTYVREKTLSNFGFLARGATITPDTAAEYGRVTAYIRKVGGDMDIDRLDAKAGGGMGYSIAGAIAIAAKNLARAIGDNLVTGNANWTVTVNSNNTGTTGLTIVAGRNHDTRKGPGILRAAVSGGNVTWTYKAPGDSEFGAATAALAVASALTTTTISSDNPDLQVTYAYTGGTAVAGDVVFTLSGGDSEFDGLQRLVEGGLTPTTTSAQVLSAGTNGANVSFALLDQLADLVVDKSGPKIYVMPRRTKRSVMALMRAAGGVTMGELQGRPMLAYAGIPILLSDWIPTTVTHGSGTNTTSVYCATIGERAGLRGIYAEGMDDDSQALRPLAMAPPGIEMFDLGMVQNADSRRIRALAYVSMLNEHQLGLARLTGVLD